MGVFVFRKEMIEMKMDKIYLVTIRQIIKKEYIEDGVHLEKEIPKTLKNAIVCLKGEKYIDIVTKEKYNREPKGIYVDETRPMVPFEEINYDLKEEIKKYGGKK